MLQRPPLDFPISIPDDIPVEDWLEERDRKPRMIPRWPKSKRMTLVALLAEDVVLNNTPENVLQDVGSLKAYVITSVDIAYDLVSYSHQWEGKMIVLFFNVLKNDVLPLCDSLQEDSWDC